MDLMQMSKIKKLITVPLNTYIHVYIYAYIHEYLGVCTCKRSSVCLSVCQ